MLMLFMAYLPYVLYYRLQYYRLLSFDRGLCLLKLLGNMCKEKHCF